MGTQTKKHIDWFDPENGSPDPAIDTDDPEAWRGVMEDVAQWALLAAVLILAAGAGWIIASVMQEGIRMLGAAIGIAVLGFICGFVARQAIGPRN